MKEQLAAFFKGDYSKVSEKKSVARGGTGRPKAPRTVFGKPAAPRRRQQGSNPNASTDDTRTENSFENRTRPGNRAKPAVARGEVSRSGPARENREDRNDRGTRDDRDNRFDDRDNTNRPANKGRGRYAPGGKAGG